MRPALACAAGLAAALSLPATAFAQDEEPVPKPRPTAPDTRAGRPTLALQLGYQRLFGSAQSGVSQGTDTLPWGLTPGLQLAYPFTREWAIEAWGQSGSFPGGTSDCPSCKATSLAGGLGAVYHLVDGLPFDPWFSFGVGFRKLHLTTPATGTVDYTGVEVLRVAMGSDYYPAKFIGFGPYLDLSAGRYLSRSPGTIDTGAGHTALGAGLRVVVSPF